MIVTNHNHQPRILPIAFAGCEIAVSRVPLRRDDASSPWCYAASLTPTIPIDDDDDDDYYGDSISPPPQPQPPGANFLATQVWPSSRTASKIIERYMDPSWTVCELGCGPGLPSLTAARAGARRVIATDVDGVALGMVRAAAIEQGFAAVEDRVGGDERAEGGENALVADDGEARRGGRLFVTMKFDLTSWDRPLPKADLYILSDVFESSSVAQGAAWHVQNVLSDNRRMMMRGVNGDEDNSKNDISRVWVFAQSDRAQRDFFLDNMREWYKQHNVDDERQQLVGWTMDHTPNRDDELWLFDLDETTVDYN